MDLLYMSHAKSLLSEFVMQKYGLKTKIKYVENWHKYEIDDGILVVTGG